MGSVLWGYNYAKDTVSRSMKSTHKVSAFTPLKDDPKDGILARLDDGYPY